MHRWTPGLIALLSFGASAAEPGREPCADADPLRRPFFGDTHVHTTYSFDANSQDTRNTPRDAYRFAQGEALGIQPYDAEGNPLRKVQLDRPLDFTVVTDHAEFLGEMNLCSDPETWAYWHPVCLAHRNIPISAMISFGYWGMVEKERWGIGLCGSDGENCREATGRFWQNIQDAAEEAYDRTAECKFTSFVGYEWTASVGQGVNLHRNVVFRDENVPALPISWLETPSAADLWETLQEECVDGVPGCDVLTIPHNSNLGAGLMFETARTSGSEAAGETTAEEARLRARWEPLVEIMQHKGDSECDARLDVWSSDEACGFEKLDYDRFGGKGGTLIDSTLPTEKDYVRRALARGLRLEQELGANPFKYGIIASTDTHIAAPGLVAEKGHPGHGGAGRGARGELPDPEEFPDDFEYSPGGLAVLWAEENTRHALFAAMQRRETYGTSGTRPVVRFFGGWDYPEDLCADPAFVAKGYANGVPMGSDLPSQRREVSPRFAVSALRDPGSGADAGGPLQRIQIVKGWLEGDALRERVVDVAGGKNGASVDLATCEPRGEGAASLCAVWTDPDFDANESAYYYARVLENPSCRWSQYVCLEAKVDCTEPDSVPEGLAACCSPDHRAAIQERAWTSPIWYRPPQAPKGVSGGGGILRE
ncbi:MAG: DUF3604 domain-containing protein [Myxococcales bacterium]|nr:DUF3604 domain-containing protein [Myxococcales bacterium]